MFLALDVAGKVVKGGDAMVIDSYQILHVQYEDSFYHKIKEFSITISPFRHV